ncbi:MAG TPA: hypothetical protein VID73_12325, partial [Ktedonobacterales bacterium]
MTTITTRRTIRVLLLTAMLFALSLALVGPRAQAAPPTPPTTPPGQRATPPDTKTTKWVVTSHHVRLQ